MIGFWTDSRVEELKRLHADGLSASMIAAEMKAPSRNAVLGKLDRLGLTSDGTPRIKKPRIPAQGQRRTPKNHLSVFLARERKAEQRKVEEPAPHVDDVARVSILELTEFTCRWPVGNPGQPGFGYCGNGVHGEGPYCIGHRARARDPRPLRAIGAPSSPKPKPLAEDRELFRQPA